MATQPRFDLPGFAQHIVQRGNDRQPCFFSLLDDRRYLQDLREIAVAEHCAVQANVLMTNPVHRLLMPRDTGSIARLMQSLGGVTFGTSTTGISEPERSGRALQGMPCRWRRVPDALSPLYRAQSTTRREGRGPGSLSMVE